MFDCLGWFSRGPLPQRRVAVAVALDRDSGRYVVAFNRRWGGYAFPTRPFSPSPGLGLREQRAEGATLLVEWGTPYLDALGGDALVLEFALSPAGERSARPRGTGARGDALARACAPTRPAAP